MPAEVIAIGDELASGERLDTNSQWLSQRLNEIGVRVLYHTTVGDELDGIVGVFRTAVERAETVVCTGGLGPTADDLTRQALADAAGVELALRDDALAHIRSLFARRQRPMPERNVIQAMFPVGSDMLANSHGSAPGIDISLPLEGPARCRIFALPGVPAEMREMWEQSVAPAILAGQIARRTIRHRRVKCFGVGESDLEAMLPDLIQRGRHPSVGITVSRATITLRVTAEAESAVECEALMQPTLATIQQCLGDLIFGEEEDELQHAVARRLAERRETLAVFESGSGGMLAHWLSDVDEVGTVFRGGIVERLPASLAGDESLAAEWAERSRSQFNADHGLAVGPFPIDANQGRIAFAVSSRSAGTITKSNLIGGHPDIIKSRAAKQALDFLRLKLRRS